MTNGQAEKLGILETALDELEQLRCRLREDNDHVQWACEVARKQERGAVVALLRKAANAPHRIERDVPWLPPAAWGLLLFYADAIERGDHRREEESK